MTLSDKSHVARKFILKICILFDTYVENPYDKQLFPNTLSFGGFHINMDVNPKASLVGGATYVE